MTNIQIDILLPIAELDAAEMWTSPNKKYAGKDPQTKVKLIQDLINFNYSNYLEKDLTSGDQLIKNLIIANGGSTNITFTEPY